MGGGGVWGWRGVHAPSASKQYKLIPKDVITGRQKTWLHKQGKGWFFPFDPWVDPAEGNNYCKLKCGLDFTE